MTKALLQMTFGFLLAAFCSYLYINAKNDLIQVQLEIPHIKRELKEIREENKRLGFEVQSFESPQHLVELSRQPEFSHLKPVSNREVLAVPYHQQESDQ
jgi:hypothetical protein